MIYLILDLKDLIKNYIDHKNGDNIFCKESNHHINLFGKLSRYFVLIDKEINKANIRDGDIKTIDDGFKSIEKYKDYF